MIILVTGAAGFLGHNLCRLLLSQGHHLIALDNCMNGNQHLLHALESDHCRIIQADVIDPLSLPESLDQIYHLACAASPPHYQKTPIHTLRTCFEGTLNMINLAKDKHARLLFSSTSEIYGDPLISPQDESYRGNVNSFGPRSCYDEGKRVAESLCFHAIEQDNVNIRIARIFNSYGPFMMPNDGRVITNFIIQALQGQELTLYGDGLQGRSFCYVDDTIDGLWRLMNVQDRPDHPINIGNPNEITIRDLVDHLQELWDSELSCSYHPLPMDDPQQRCPMIHKAQELLGFEPTTPLSEGLAHTIAYFRSITI